MWSCSKVDYNGLFCWWLGFLFSYPSPFYTGGFLMSGIQFWLNFHQSVADLCRLQQKRHASTMQIPCFPWCAQLKRELCPACCHMQANLPAEGSESMNAGGFHFPGLPAHPDTWSTLSLSMAKIPIVFRNVRGLHSPFKALYDLYVPEKNDIVFCFQETHLTAETMSSLWYSWVGRAYHSTHTSYFRGISVLIYGALGYREYDSVIDMEGCFVFIHCRFYTLSCVYIPLPFTAAVTRLLIAFLDSRPAVPLLVILDFNCCLNPAEDRHLAPRPSTLSRGIPLVRLLQEMGWVNIWQNRNPGVKQLQVSQYCMVVCLELIWWWAN